MRGRFHRRSHRRNSSLPLILAVVLLTAGAVPSLQAQYEDPDGPGGGDELGIVEITVSTYQFDPADVVIKPGDTVRWRNTGGIHNVAADDGSFRCANGCDGEGGDGTASGNAWVVERTFDDPGVIDYHCQTHQAIGMVGSITVEGDGQTSQPGKIVMKQTPVTVDEGDSQVQLTLQRQDGSDGAVEVDFTTVDGDAKAGSDYESTNGTVAWADGDSADKQVAVTILDDGTVEGNETFDVELSSPSGGASLGNPSKARVRIFDDDVEITECEPDEETLCLNQDGRFQVEVTFDAGEGPQPGKTITFGQRDSGIFWFFDQTNAELLVKVLDACIPALGNKFWVFFAATTDVQFDLVVTDTERGVSKTYSHAGGTAAPPVSDTAAFDTCG